MTIDWCPGIREACGYWHDAPMLQQTFDAMERNLEQNNDACIDCAKTVVEVVCRVVVESFHTQQAPLKPTQETPSLSDWLTAAIRALKLGDVRDDRFKKLVSSHHKLADALNDLRNKAGPRQPRQRPVSGAVGRAPPPQRSSGGRCHCGLSASGISGCAARSDQLPRALGAICRR